MHSWVKLVSHGGIDLSERERKFSNRSAVRHETLRVFEDRLGLTLEGGPIFGNDVGWDVVVRRSGARRGPKALELLVDKSSAVFVPNMRCTARNGLRFQKRIVVSALIRWIRSTHSR